MIITNPYAPSKFYIHQSVCQMPLFHGIIVLSNHSFRWCYVVADQLNWHFSLWDVLAGLFSLFYFYCEQPDHKAGAGPVGSFSRMTRGWLSHICYWAGPTPHPLSSLLHVSDTVGADKVQAKSRCRCCQMCKNYRYVCCRGCSSSFNIYLYGTRHSAATGGRRTGHVAMATARQRSRQRSRCVIVRRGECSWSSGGKQSNMQGNRDSQGGSLCAMMTMMNED